MLFRLWNYIRGYVIINIEGLGLERFLNLLNGSGVELWSLRRISRIKLTARAHWSSRKKIAQAAEKANCSVSFETAEGIPVRFTKALRRWALFLGAIVFLAAVYTATRFVWFINVKGTQGERRDAIFEQISQMGIRPGTLWSEIDIKKIERLLMIQNDWAAFIIGNRVGTLLEIEIIEENPKPEILIEGAPCDIIADRDAIIHSITAYEGIPVAKAGKVVHKGDVLISGAYPRDSGAPRLVAARGKVLAKLYYSHCVIVPFEYIIKQETGNVCQTRTLVLGGWEITLTPVAEGFGEYFIGKTEEIPVSQLYFPAKVVKNTLVETRDVIKTRDAEQAEQLGIEYATKKAKEKMPEGAEIEETIVTTKHLENGIEVRVYIETIEEIGEVRYYQ